MAGKKLILAIFLLTFFVAGHAAAESITRDPNTATVYANDSTHLTFDGLNPPYTGAYWQYRAFGQGAGGGEGVSRSRRTLVHSEG